MKRIAGALCLALLPGCASTYCTVTSPSPYGGTTLEAAAIVYRDDPFTTALCVLDLPFTVVFDTLFLPYTLLASASR